MKIILTESQLNDVIDKFITFKLEPYEERFSKRYPDSIFWVKGGEIIAEVNKKYNRFYLSSDIWHSISKMFSLDIDETKQVAQVMRNWLEEHYKLGGLTPNGIYRHGSWLLEQH